jgi:hypothetical protein
MILATFVQIALLLFRAPSPDNFISIPMLCDIPLEVWALSIPHPAMDYVDPQ